MQRHINEFDSTLLQRLNVIIPALQGGSYNPAEFSLPTNLVKIVAAFAPSDIFRKRPYMERCLNRLPPEVLFGLANAVGVSSESNDFETTRDLILSRGWTSIKFQKSFLNFFDLPEHFITPQQISIPNYEDYLPPTHANPNSITSAYKQLKVFQMSVLGEALRRLHVKLSRFIIQMPTGAGKTRTAVELVTQYINDSGDNPIVVWLAHSEELCEQACQCFKDVWVHVARKKIRLIRGWGGGRISEATDESTFIVGSFQKLHSMIRKNNNLKFLFSSRVRLIIVDEAHKSTAPTYKQVISALCNDKTRIVGLTATPGRTIMDETRELADFYFQDIVNIDTGSDMSPVSYLTSIGVLSSVNYIQLRTSVEYALTLHQKRRMEQDFDFPKGFLDKMGNDDIRNIEIMKRLLLECSVGNSVLFFACSINQSMFVTALLLYFNYSAAHIDGHTERNRRSSIISGFRSGDIKVLCNYGVLSTGFDAPNTDTVFIARPTNSVVLYSQMIGRGLRGPAVGGTQSCRIIDVIDNIQGYGDQDRVYKYFDEFWN